MIAFWIAAGVFSAVAAIIVLFRAARAAALAEPVDATAVLYQRQIAELDDLTERGLLGPAERASAQAEAGRRLLNATDHPDLAWTPGVTRRAPLAVAIVAAPLLALALYLVVGAPGTADQPFAGRLAAWSKVSNPLQLPLPELAALIKQRIKTSPDKLNGYRFLAQVEAAAGNGPGVVTALRRAVQLAPEQAELWTVLGQAQLTLNGGEVNEEARESFEEALKRDPGSPDARFYLAQAEITGGDRARGLAIWRQLLAELPAADPRHAQLQAAISEAEAMPAAGPAAGPRGLSADQLTAVRGMVAGLAAKLKADPSDAAGWVRLVRAYAVLGDTAARDAALKEARARNASRPDVLDELNKAAAVEAMK